MRHSPLPVLALLLAMFAGLSTSPAAEARGYRCGQCGTVEDVDRIWYDRRDDGRYDQRGDGRYDQRGDGRDSGREGAVLGAIIGGALGNQVGRGDGRKAATIAGLVVGGLVGHNVDRNDGRNDGRGGQRGDDGMRLSIRMDRGFNQTVEIHGNMRIYRGDRVRLRNGRVELID